MIDRQVIWPVLVGAGQAYRWPAGNAGREKVGPAGILTGRDAVDWWAEAVAGKAKLATARVATMTGAARRECRSLMPIRRICPSDRFTDHWDDF